jgi:hypothetical protein
MKYMTKPAAAANSVRRTSLHALVVTSQPQSRAITPRVEIGDEERAEMLETALRTLPRRAGRMTERTPPFVTFRVISVDKSRGVKCSVAG